MKAKKPYILITCEHADYQIPKFVKSALPDWYTQKLARGHQGYDQYALESSEEMKLELKKLGFKVDVISYPFTRLLIDANRTKENNGFYSKLSSYLTNKELTQVEKMYESYKKKCETLIKKNLTSTKVYVFSVHSFTPIFKGQTRKTDVGLLFRNKISKEKTLATKLKKELQKNDLNFNIHLNLPYRGHTDCFLNSVLDQYKNNTSVNGLFFEFNQNFLKSGLKPKSKCIAHALSLSLEA